MHVAFFYLLFTHIFFYIYSVNSITEFVALCENDSFCTEELNSFPAL